MRGNGGIRTHNEKLCYEPINYAVRIVMELSITEVLTIAIYIVIAKKKMSLFQFKEMWPILQTVTIRHYIFLNRLYYTYQYFYQIQ